MRAQVMPAQLYPRRDFPCGHPQMLVCSKCAAWHRRNGLRQALFLPHLGGDFRSLIKSVPAPRIQRRPASFLIRNSR